MGVLFYERFHAVRYLFGTAVECIGCILGYISKSKDTRHITGDAPVQFQADIAGRRMEDGDGQMIVGDGFFDSLYFFVHGSDFFLCQVFFAVECSYERQIPLHIVVRLGCQGQDGHTVLFQQGDEFFVLVFIGQYQVGLAGHDFFYAYIVDRPDFRDSSISFRQFRRVRPDRRPSGKITIDGISKIEQRRGKDDNALRLFFNRHRTARIIGHLGKYGRRSR